MATDFFARSDTLEECYEFMLAYAGQGLPSEQGSTAGSQIRAFLERATRALSGLAASCRLAVSEQQLEPTAQYQAFVSILDRDAQDSLAAIELVLAQPVISSQLIDNLNASMHLRALLTDLFLIGEILNARIGSASPTT
jgi:hypothetical protein